MVPEPVLLFAYGNISRGDDALAPLLVEQIQQQGITHVSGHPLKFLTDYQMQIEHVMDLKGCERVLLVDADVSLDKAFCFYPVTERLESLYTTHGMSPSTLLHTFELVFKEKSPVTSMLAIQGISFELGDDLSDRAVVNLKQAVEFLGSILSEKDFILWDEQLEI